MEYLFLCTGGTIDKHYPRTMGGYSFEFGPPAVENIMQRIRPKPAFTFRYQSIGVKKLQFLNIAGCFFSFFI